jgi:flagellar basal body-associated protein FliL
MRVRNRAIILILLPVTIFLWLIGWTLFWTGTKNKHRKPKPVQQANTTITTGILLENHEEITT